MNIIKKIVSALLAIPLLFVLGSCSQGGNGGALGSSVAERVYVPPGEHDEFYAFISGGFSGQLAIHGLPSGKALQSCSGIFRRC